MQHKWPLRDNKALLYYSLLSLVASCSRKASLRDKVFPSPSKSPGVKRRAQSPGAEDRAEAKVTKSWSFNEKNRGAKTAFRIRSSTSRQNSEGERTLHLKCNLQFRPLSEQLNVWKTLSWDVGQNICRQMTTLTSAINVLCSDSLASIYPASIQVDKALRGCSSVPKLH